MFARNEKNSYGVLVISDDVTLARAIFPALYYVGLDCQYAPDGATGLEATVEIPPHLVLLDIRLPDMDSYVACVAIRRLTNAPILLMGKTDERKIVCALKAGADGYLTKPCQPRIWVARVEAQLRRVYCYDAPITPLADLSASAPDKLFKRLSTRKSVPVSKNCSCCGVALHTLTLPCTMPSTKDDEQICVACALSPQLAAA